MADEKKKTEIEAGDDAPPVRRVGFFEFCQQVNREFRKVTWPSWKETKWTTVMVFVMVAFTMVFFFVVDSILNYGELLLIGARSLF